MFSARWCQTALCALCCSVAWAQDRIWTPASMMQTVGVLSAQLSPDNQSALVVAPTRQTVEGRQCVQPQITCFEEREGEWMRSSRLPESWIGRQPAWSPDGRWIAFLAKEKKSGITQLFLKSMEGELRKVTASFTPIQLFAWSPDGRSIAYVKANEASHQDPICYRASRPQNSLWLIEQVTTYPQDRLLVRGSYSVHGHKRSHGTDFDWAPDGRTIVFSYSASSRTEDEVKESHLGFVEVASGCVTLLDTPAIFESSPKFSPDGRAVAYLSDDSSQRFARNWQAAVYFLDSKERRHLATTAEGGSFLLGWTEDGKGVWVSEPAGTKTRCLRLDLDGSLEEQENGSWLRTSHRLSRDRSQMTFVGERSDEPPEAYVISLASSTCKKISNFNQKLSLFPKLHTEVVSWASSDGLPIEGLLTYPLESSNTPGPLLVIVHGGPMFAFQESFLGRPDRYPLAAFAQQGFALLRPNPRGSTGYGKAVRCMLYRDWGRMDAEDILTGVDALIERGVADPRRLGVMGWSYGGYLSAVLLTKTDRFQAASLGAGDHNLVGLAGTIDLDGFCEDHLGEYADDPTLYLERSPLFHMQGMTTPCLLQHGLEDQRVPVSQSYELYHTLIRLGQNPILELYPEEGHQFQNPHHILRCMESNLDWFQRHLGRS